MEGNGLVNLSVRSPETSGLPHEGKRIVTAGGENTARVWDAATGQILAALRGHTAPINSAVFSPDS
jgi:WD40 repeat protein